LIDHQKDQIDQMNEMKKSTILALAALSHWKRRDARDTGGESP
jgi:hypothetical protein